MGKKPTTEEATQAKGRAVILPNGEKRVDFIRNRYYNADGVHDEETKNAAGDGNCLKRGPIRLLINAMYKNEDDHIMYQIVFAATKTDQRPVPKEKAAPADESAE